MPFTRAAKRRPTRSSQPQRRSRPVSVPNSAPMLDGSRRAALGVGLARERAGADARQVRLGDADHATRSCVGPMPLPVQTPPATGLRDVTNG